MRTLIALFLLAFSIGAGAQTTATNFTCNDCAGNPHDLFTELDSGDVIVISFVMPCATCLPPTLTAYNIVQSYATSHPGRVKMYIADDYANTTCASLDNWATSNNMPNSTRFSNTAVDMLDYGAAGMPKIVVLGGLTHHVYYNTNGSGNATQLQEAIDSALAETGVRNDAMEVNPLSVYPVPASGNVTLNFSSVENGIAVIDIFSVDGKKATSAQQSNVTTGNNVIEVSTAELSAGTYMITVSIGDRVMRSQIVIE